MWVVLFQVVPVCAWGMAVATAVLPLKLGRRATLLAMLVLAMAFGKFAFYSIVGGNAFNPDLPQHLIWACGWVYAAAMMFSGFSAVSAALEGVMRLAHRQVSVRTKRIRVAVVAALAVSLSGWGMYEGVRQPDVRRIEISWHELPEAFDGYRIVHLSDLHCSPAALRDRFEKIVDRVNALDADLVVMTGDFVDGTVCERGRDLEPLGSLRAKDGVWGCTGNHEAYWEWDRWSMMFRRWNVRFLPSGMDGGTCEVISRGDDSIALGGLHDPAFSRFGDVSQDAREAFAGAPVGAFRILMFHRPITEEINATAADVRLQLSGHTHGGAMPGVSILVAMANEGHVRGLYEFAPGRYLYNSPGTGQWAGFPLRLLNPAEITEIVLRKRRDAK